MNLIWKSVAGEDRSGRPDKGTDLFEASDHHFHEQFMESFSSTSCSKLDDDRAWSCPESNKAWEQQRIGLITSSQSYREFDGIDGEPTEFEWNIFPGF